jgi:CDP-paratose 2-epimerase
LVTGAAGFLGTAVCEHFKRKGWDVLGIDNLTTYELKRNEYDYEEARMHNIDFLKNLDIDFMVRDIGHIPLYKEPDCDFIIHCAAQPTMTLSIKDPTYDFDVNVHGTLNVLELARKLDVPMVNCSSIHVYGNKINQNLIEQDTDFDCEPKMFDEDYPILNGDMTPLHASKRAAELYVRTYAETYGLKAATFRLTGMYGPRQFAGMEHGWVANFAIRNLMNRPITIFDTAKQVRDILYVDDAAKAFECWYEGGKPEIYNIGGGLRNKISLHECLGLIKDITGKEQNITVKPKRFGDLYYFVCDTSKAEEDFGWMPTISNRIGLERMIEWIEENKELFK